MRGNRRNLVIKSGNEETTLTSFPSKANPTVAHRINLLSVHFNTLNKNDSEFYCNGQQLDRFITDSLNGQNTFTIRAIANSVPRRLTAYKGIYYFSLFCNYFFNPKDIKRMHKHLCERYSIHYDPVDIS